MNVSFYFDPSCPWCWVTSRWLADVATKRDINVNWQPFSLAMKNNELHDDNKAKSPYEKTHRESHRVLRVIEAAAQAGGDRGKLYSDIGRMKHVEKYDYTDTEIEMMLNLSQLDTNLAQAADDESYDIDLQKSLDEAIAVVGEDVGVPLIIFEQNNYTKVGYFGPVLMKQPTGDEALKLWDGLSKLAESADFYELKRSRPKGGPDTTEPKSKMVC